MASHSDSIPMALLSPTSPNLLQLDFRLVDFIKYITLLLQNKTELEFLTVRSFVWCDYFVIL